MKKLDEKRDEKAEIVLGHFNEIGASVDDVFKYGWDACAKEYDINISSLEDKVYHSTRKVEELLFKNESLKKKLEIAKEALQEIKFASLQGDETPPEINCYNLADDCLFKLKSAGE